MRRLSLRRDVAHANRIMRQGFGLLAGAVIIAAMIIAVTGSVFARGGYGPRKEPTPFAPKELLLIEKCRAVVQAVGMNSSSFLRECSAVRSYVYY